MNAVMNGTQLRTVIAEEDVLDCLVRSCCRANGAKDLAQGGPSLGECCPGTNVHALPACSRSCPEWARESGACAKGGHALCRPVRHFSRAPSERGLGKNGAS